jgi:glycolate oxidase FAD binding subunit
MHLRPLPAANGRYSLALSVAGGASAVERTRSEIERLAQEFGAVDETASESTAKGRRMRRSEADVLSCRAAVVPNRLPRLIEAFEREAPAEWSAEPIDGRVSAEWEGRGNDGELVARLRDVVSTLSGSLVVTRCDLELKKRIDVFGDPPSSFLLMRRIKEQFDPDRILSPGRFVGRL